MAESLHDFFDDHAQWTGPVPEPPSGQPSRREKRKQRKARNRKRMRIIITAIIVLACVIGGGYAVVRTLGNINTVEVQRTTAEDYEGPGDGSVSFTIESGQSSSEVAQNLVKEGIVKSVGAFTQALAASQKDVAIQPGTFDLKYHMSAASVVAILTDPTKASGFLVVTPGERMSKIIKQAAQISGIDNEEFQNIVDQGGQGILPEEAQGKFEGWIEPGSYNVKSKHSASEILQEMVQARIAKLDKLGVPAGADRERILIIASIAEAEVNKAEYYGKVARVIENRLTQNMTLGMDSTVAYGLGIQTLDLTNAQLQDATNPYNTRVNAGLPPTPISMPGDNAIQAAMDPPAGDWIYFVTVNLQTGETKFTADKDQFEEYVAEYKAYEKQHANN